VKEGVRDRAGHQTRLRVPTTTKSYPGISSESELLRMDIRRQGSEPWV